MKIKKIAVITGARSEFGILIPIIERIIKSEKLKLILYATGMHLLEEYGSSIEEIQSLNYPNLKIVPMYDEEHDQNSKTFIGKSISLGISNFTDSFSKDKPDIVLILGDRVEMISATISAATQNIALAHIHGGDVSENAQIDEQIRHAITKLSHLHFTATELSKKRVIQMGEENWRVYNTGSPSIDYIKDTQFFTKEKLIQMLQLEDKILPEDDIILCIQHPTIFESEKSGVFFKETLECLKRLGKHTIIIYPNNDPGSDLIIDIIKKSENVPIFHIFKNLERKKYLSIMKHALFMIGNSSSGIIESALFKLPVLNIGIRNLNRECSDNVVTIKNGTDNIWEGIQKIIDPKFINFCKSIRNIYGDGNASEKIVKILEEIELNYHLFNKKFILNDT